MINKEIKHLTRRELVDIIYQLKKNEQDMQAELESLRRELQEQRIRVSVAGSIADAAMSITNVFSAAQATADLYLREIEYMKQDTEKECAEKIADAENHVQKMLDDCEKQFATLKSHYKRDYRKWQQLKAEVEALEQAKSEDHGHD